MEKWVAGITQLKRDIEAFKKTNKQDENKQQKILMQKAEIEELLVKITRLEGKLKNLE